MDSHISKTGQKIKFGVFLLAPVIFSYLVFFVKLDIDNPQITYTLAVAILMALWWVTEIVPLAITSLLPVILFPILGIMNGKDVSSTYFNHVILLFLGGFLVALAMQKWNLHKRIALKILLLVGTGPAKILLGFMLATAFLSMWISNTATTMLMIPILISIINQLEKINSKEAVKHFSIGLLLSIAYSASIGGIATLVGTPPNLSFARIFSIYFPNAPEISFATWFFYAFPIVVVMFAIAWFYLYLVFVKRKNKWKSFSKENLLNIYKELGKWSQEEKIMLIVFVSMALLWFFRADITIGSTTLYGWQNLFKNPNYFNDGTVAIFIATILFVIPSKQQKGKFLMDWKTAEGIPWEIILLFGGGFALATGFKESGLSHWFGEQLIWLKDVHPFLIVLAITIIITFLTEITSNTATIETFLPVLAGLAMSIEMNPLLFMLPATIASSLAFMLPVATPPNAIVFGTNRLQIIDMTKTGFFLNIAGIIIVTLATYYLGTFIFNIQLDAFPLWAK
ncbi:MAG: SLC13 family permease [Flavobacteriaceae bacterium]|nr:SLC13 family permease [Flavobacteriaceae bacterium]